MSPGTARAVATLAAQAASSDTGYDQDSVCNNIGYRQVKLLERAVVTIISIYRLLRQTNRLGILLMSVQPNKEKGIIYI